MINWSFSITKFPFIYQDFWRENLDHFAQSSPVSFSPPKEYKNYLVQKNRRRKLNFPFNKNFFARDNAFTTKYQKAVRKDLTFRWKFSRSHIPYLSSHFNDFFANLTSISLSLKLFMLLFTEQFILPALACSTGHTKLKAHRRF